MGKIGIIARREFNERVKKKSFIITTILMPLFFVAIIGVSVYMGTMRSDEVRNIAVVDDSGIVAPKLEDTGVLHFEVSGRSYDEIRGENREDLFGILHIGADIMTDSRNIEFYTYEASTMTIESGITGQINSILEDEKLKAYEIDNLAEIMNEVKTNVSLRTMEITSSGESRDSSSVLSMAAAYIFGFLIYMFVFLYGNMVMQGVIEEKGSKVLELMVSSVKPFQLMMGKIIGIASVAVTQLVIWVVFIVVVGGAVMNFFAGDMMETAAAMQSGMPVNVDMASVNLDQVALINRLTDVGYLTTLIGGFILYFIGGYLLYAALFAAVGSAVDNEKDTQNLQLPITIPLILGIIVMINVMNDPHTSIAFWFSIIPFTSPVVMMARLPYGVPGWELALSLVLLYLTFVGTVWLAGKIYRVGIFMYGKKPTFKELYKWSKYKS
jgi:ABC-2 type transport system permease protein